MTKNPFLKPYPYWHQTTIGRLASILQYGLLSPAAAKNLKLKGYRRNFNSSWNKKTVSLMANESPREATAPHIAILIDPKKILKTRAVFIKADTNRPVPNEILVRDRVLPQKIIGIVIGEVGYSFKLEKPVKPKPLSLNRILTEITKANLNLALPIYFKGHQLWPPAE